MNQNCSWYTGSTPPSFHPVDWFLYQHRFFWHQYLYFKVPLLLTTSIAIDNTKCLNWIYQLFYSGNIKIPCQYWKKKYISENFLSIYVDWFQKCFFRVGWELSCKHPCFRDKKVSLKNVAINVFSSSETRWFSSKASSCYCWWYVRWETTKISHNK